MRMNKEDAKGLTGTYFNRSPERFGTDNTLPVKVDRETLLGLAERTVYREIYNCLSSHGEKIKTKQLIEETGLNYRTAYYRANELKLAGVIGIDMMFNKYFFYIKPGKTAEEFGKMVKKFEKKEKDLEK